MFIVLPFDPNDTGKLGGLLLVLTVIGVLVGLYLWAASWADGAYDRRRASREHNHDELDEALARARSVMTEAEATLAMLREADEAEHARGPARLRIRRPR